MSYLLQHFDLFLLVSLRIVAFVSTSPLMSMNVWPRWAKIGLAFGLAYVAAPTIDSPVPDILTNPGQFIVDGVMEAVIGLLLGFIATLVFSAISIAGQAVDIQIGFSMAQLVAPGSTAQMGIMGNLYNLLFTLYFLGMGGLDGMMLAILHSFSVIHIGVFHLPSDWPGTLLHLTGLVMSMGVELAAPLLVALFLSDVTFAFLSRAVPQMNVFVVSLPVKLFAGLAMFAIVMPGTMYLFNQLFSFVFNQLQVVLQAMGG
ncbi:flagellar biosynthetic protein FliR [Alicyclobacillus fastidiosus]|uniref:Flagellar biosynthetic protein FliR n=1 Tax=Alicyclobacillus fastidiosus TaxID=392011 RepID=A0ABV5AGQ4_9BACL|nr:flagellar biosynthetic protein FliR [Alicyclobacillus fastidiosus]WEH07915.1 flagellar biosynthetic protein FliR [Alicyclobacillus fastidiosus]